MEADTVHKWPYPDDPDAPNAEELSVIQAMRDEIAKTPGLTEELSKTADEWAFLVRFSRGYYYNQFKKLSDDDRLFQTTRIIKRALTWRKENSVSLLADRVLPRRREFDNSWVSGVSGFSKTGQPVYNLMTMDPKICEGFTKEEVAWLHWQEYEWLDRQKAQNAQALKRIVKDQIVIVDFGDGTHVKGHGISKSSIDWFKSAVKWEPPDLDPGEQPMDVDGYCYPESLCRLYMLNASFAIRSVWSIAKQFVYPTTRKKFRIMGFDAQANLKHMLDDGLPIEAIPSYLGGAGINPPGLVLHDHIKRNSTHIIKVRLPEQHCARFRFHSKTAIQVNGNFTSPASSDEEVCGWSLTPKTWQDGKMGKREEAGLLTFTVKTGSHSTEIKYEVSVLAQASDVGSEISVSQVSRSQKAAATDDYEMADEGTEGSANSLPPIGSAPAATPATSTLARAQSHDTVTQKEGGKKPRTHSHPMPANVASWITKRKGFRGSVVSLDQTPLTSLEGYLDKYGTWMTGFQSRYFRVNNAYLNYYAGEEFAHTKPLGSYNLKKLAHVMLVGGNTVDLMFRDEHGVEKHAQLKACDTATADHWVNQLEERRSFFEELGNRKKPAASANKENTASSPPIYNPTTDSKVENSPVTPTPVFLAQRGSPSLPKGQTSKRQLVLVALVCTMVGMILGFLLGSSQGIKHKDL